MKVKSHTALHVNLLLILIAILLEGLSINSQLNVAKDNVKTIKRASIEVGDTVI